MEGGEQDRPWRSVLCQLLFASRLGSKSKPPATVASYVNNVASNTDGSDFGPSGAKSLWDNTDEIRLVNHLRTAEMSITAVDGEIQII